MDESFKFRSLLTIHPVHSPPNKNNEQEHAWLEGESVEVGNAVWELNPIGGLCRKCGTGVEAVSSAEGRPKAEVVEEALTDRTAKARIILLSEVAKGQMPRGFTAASVRTLHEVGMYTGFDAAAVSRRHFADHKELSIDPKSIPGNKTEQRCLDVMSSELKLESSVLMSSQHPIPADLPRTNVNLFHKTTVQLLECSWRLRSTS